MKRFLNALGGMYTPFYNADDGGGDGGDGGNKDGDSAGKTFTQAELDAKIADRLARQAKKYEGFDDIKSERDRLKAEEDARISANLTETERLKADADESNKTAREAVDKADKAIATANKRVIDAEIRSIARSLNANDANDVLAFVDIAKIAIDDDGNVTGVDEAVKAVKDAKPYLFKAAASGADAGGGSNADRRHDPNAGNKTKLAELAEKARQSGRTEDKVAYASFKREMDAKK